MKSSSPSSNARRFNPVASLAGLLILGVLQTHAQTPDPSSLITEHIRGVVLNSVDHRPVSRVLVVSNDQRMATFTDSEGRFSFDVRRSASTGSALMGTLPTMPGGRPIDPGMLRALRSGAGFLNLRKPGYISSDVSVRISPDLSTTTEDLQFNLIPACNIRGHISTPTGNPPVGIMVQLRSRQVQFGMEVWAQAASARVNSHGDFHFADLPAGDYKVMSSAWTEDPSFSPPPQPDHTSGYKPAFYTEALDFASAPAIHLRPGDTTEADLNLRNATLYHVSIPLPNAQNGSVSVIVGSQEEDSGYSLLYNFQSQTVDGFLPNGAYDVRVFGYGEQPSSGRGRIEVAGSAVKGAPITMVPDGQIPIIVHEQFTGVTPQQPNPGSAIARAQAARPVDVFLRPYGGNGPGANMGGGSNNGNSPNLLLSGVAEGRYRVVANASRGYISSITANGVDLLRQPLVVGPGGASQPIEITLRDDSGSLNGAISMPQGQPEPDAQLIITCIPLNISTTASISQTGAFQGRFMMQNLPPGQYLVIASPNPTPNLDYLNPGLLSRLQSRGTTVTLAPGEKQDIQVPLLSDLGDLIASEN
jgi:hypothetical protein